MAANASLFRAVLLHKVNAAIDARYTVRDNIRDMFDVFDTLDVAKAWLCQKVHEVMSECKDVDHISTLQQVILTSKWRDYIGKIEYVMTNGDLLSFYIAPFTLNLNRKIPPVVEKEVSERDAWVASFMATEDYTCDINFALENWKKH